MNTILMGRDKYSSSLYVNLVRRGKRVGDDVSSGKYDVISMKISGEELEKSTYSPL